MLCAQPSLKFAAALTLGFWAVSATQTFAQSELDRATRPLEQPSNPRNDTLGRLDPERLPVNPDNNNSQDLAGGVRVPNQTPPPIPVDAVPPELRAPDVTQRAVAAPDPYAALGLRLGSFLLFPEIQTGVEYSDNPEQSTGNPQSAFGLRLNPSVRLESNWSRHALRGSVSGDYVFYNRDEIEDQDEFAAEVAARVDITRRTILNLSAGYDLEKASRGGGNQVENSSELADETTLRGEASLAQRFNRLIVTLRGRFEAFGFEDVDLTDGTTQANDDRDYTEYTAALRAGYELSPAVTGFVEAAYTPRRHKQETDDDGFRRDSDGYEVFGGATFRFDALWQGEIAVGYQTRIFDDTRFDRVDGLLARAELTWRPTRLTTVRFTADTEIDETTATSSAAFTTYEAGIRLEHAFLRNLVGFGALNITHRDFSNSAEKETLWELSSGIEYFLNRNVSVVARYNYEQFESNQSGSDYIENSVLMALRLRK